jgi:hypothetical protein
LFLLHIFVRVSAGNPRILADRRNEIELRTGAASGGSLSWPVGMRSLSTTHAQATVMPKIED